MSHSTTEKLDFKKLSVYQPRQFVPPFADIKDLEVIKSLYNTLLDREVVSSEALTRWILDHSELDAVLEQYSSILYVLMTCQTDDAVHAQNYTNFIETIVPALKPLDDRLNQKYLELFDRFQPDEERYGIYTRAIRVNRELFVAKNVPLQTKIDLLSQEYQVLCGAMTVAFDGRERTMPEMGKYLLEPDRELRERAWRASSERRLTDHQKLDDLLDQMTALRHEIAVNAGFSNFRDYKFKALHRFDYTPESCTQYHDSVEKLVVPLWSRIQKKRRETMRLTELRPWDTAVDPFSRPPLKPFDKVEDLIVGCQDIFNRVDLSLGAQFSEMVQLGLLDLGSRKGKAPGGYQTTLSEARKPFIFMNAVGVDGDVRTLLHESGHAFHSLACSHDPLLSYRHGPMEFNEVASMGMELLGDQYLNVFYTPEEEQRSRVKHLEDIVFTLAWVATVDAFQHWIYENPTHTQEERRQKWISIYSRFSGGVVDWSGEEEVLAFLWHRQLHIFEVPFYYIEYGIAQLGALQLWLNSQKNREKALAQYREALSFGGSRPLPELFEIAGLKFNFSESTIAPLIRAVEYELNQLGA